LQEKKDRPAFGLLNAEDRGKKREETPRKVSRLRGVQKKEGGSKRKKT